MRIGLVIDRLDPNLGGAEQWTFQYARWLVTQGHDVHLIACCFHDRVMQLGATTHKLACDRSQIRFGLAAEQKAKSLSLDIVHDMGRGWYCDVFHPHNGSRTAAAEQKLLTMPRWLRTIKRAVRGFLPRQRDFQRLLARQYVSDHRIVIALANRVANQLQQMHGVCPRQIRQIYNGADIQRYCPAAKNLHRESMRRELQISPEEVVLLFVAHNFSLKGLPTVLRALSQLRRQHPVKLLVVGGKRLGLHQGFARRLGLAGTVNWAGSVVDTVPYFAASDIFVLPTFYDPCSLVALEAMATGLPVITSQFNGVSELMTEGREGFVMQDPGNHHELIALVKRLMDRQQRERTGRAARQLAEAHSLESNFEKIFAVYGEIVARKRRAPADSAALGAALV